MSDLIDRAKAALEIATPGPWTVEMEHQGELGFNYAVLFNGNKMIDVAEMVRTEEDARLIALAPDLARIAIAAKELADAADSVRSDIRHISPCLCEQIESAIAAFREACGGVE